MGFLAGVVIPVSLSIGPQCGLEILRAALAQIQPFFESFRYVAGIPECGLGLTLCNVSCSKGSSSIGRCTVLKGR